MGKIITFENYGGPEVLRVSDQPTPSIGPNEVLLRHTAIGVNHVDVWHRNGEDPIASGPKVLGVEACGVIEKVGAAVGNCYNIGDRVVYATGPAGAYCERRAVHEDYIVRAPDYIEDNILAAGFLNGLTAHYLVTRAFVVSQAMGILVHAVDEVQGQFIASWALSRGAFVLGTISNEDKRQAALDAGIHRIINYKTEDLLSSVLTNTDGLKLNAVYDSIGQETFYSSLSCLRTFGIMLSIGHSSGPIAPVDLRLLKENSLFLTCPTITDYKANRMELLLSAEEVFRSINEGVIKPVVGASYPLSDASVAHQALMSGQVQGSIILIP